MLPHMPHADAKLMNEGRLALSCQPPAPRLARRLCPPAVSRQPSPTMPGPMPLPTCSVLVNAGSFMPSKCAARESSSALSPGWLFQEHTWKSSMTCGREWVGMSKQASE